MQEPVLVLNATFEPINVTAVRRAMVLMIKGVAQAEEVNHTQVALRFEGAPRTVGDSPAGYRISRSRPSPFTEKYLAARS